MEAISRVFSTLGFKFLILIGILFLTACQSTRSLDRSTMAMGFTEAAFGLGIEFSGKHSALRSKKIRRWEKGVPVKLVIKGEPQGSKLFSFIEESLKDLYKIAPLDLSGEIGLSKQLLRVEVKDESLLVEDDLTAPCYTEYTYERDGYLRTVDIVVTRSSLEGRVSNCLLHEGMHSLGFGGHPHRLQSVLSYTESYEDLTKLDRKLIQLLYNEKFEKEMRLNNALTTAYSMLGSYKEPKGKRYLPQDLSLELTQDESPLLFKLPFMENASKRFFYQTKKDGSTNIEINYGTRSTEKKFASLQHTILSNDKIFGKQYRLSEYAEGFEPYYGKATETLEGLIENEIGNFKYLLVNSSNFSCVFTIKYINAFFLGNGGHQAIYGNYCSDILSPLSGDDAREFITSIQLVNKDPVKVRERKTISWQNKEQKISALRLTGIWPVDNSHISGMKIIEGGETSGQIKIVVNNEACEGMLSNLGTNGLGNWELECNSNESSQGRFSWDKNGSFSFKGQTNETLQDINWTAYQIF